MPKSRKNKDRKENLLNYKTKRKQMNQELAQKLPPVRSIPTWPQDAKIEVTGFEWEAIQNAIVQMQVAQQAAQSIMSRNILNGQITMDFEKLNPQTLEYEPMNVEEKQKHVNEYNEMLANFKASLNKRAETIEPVVAESTIITESGQPYVGENESEPEPQTSNGAKVIQMVTN